MNNSEEEIYNALFNGTESLFLGMATSATIQFFANAFCDEKFESSLKYYLELLASFAKDHPVIALSFTKAVANVLGENPSGGFLSGAIFAGSVSSIRSYQKEFQDKLIAKALSRSFYPPKADDIIKLFKKGNIFTADGKTYYQVSSKFGDDPSFLEVFEISKDGHRRPKEQIKLGEKFADKSQVRKSFAEFCLKNELRHVTSLIIPTCR